MLVAVIGLVASACGGDEEEPQSTGPTATGGTATGATATGPTAETGGGAPEVSDITLGLLPIGDVAPVYIAADQGMFEAEGLNVTIQLVQSGATAIPALISGELDVTFGNYVSFFLANNEGLGLQIIAEQNRATPGFTSVLTLPDSGIEDAAGLEGHSVAVNALSNVLELTTRAQIADAGGDPDTVEFVEIPFPDMMAALERGDVDAIVEVEPFVTISMGDLGAVEVANPYGGRLEGFPVAGFYVTGEFAADNPNTIAAFQRAMVSASQLAASDPDQVVQILPTYTPLTADLAGVITQPEYVSEVDVSGLEVVVDLMVEFGMLPEAPDVSALVIPTS